MKLNQLDKKVLCGAVKFPNLSIRELSEALNVNYWTAYKALEKMKKEELFKEIIIPDFQALGFELLVVGYGSLNKRKMSTLQRIKHIKEHPRFSSGIFYSFAESYRGFVLAVSKNFTEVFKGLIYAERLIKVREFFQTENTKMIIFPFEITDIPMFFDYGPLLCKDLGVEIEEINFEKENKRKLRDREMKILQKIVENPAISISNLAKTTGMAQQSVSKIRAKLFREGWLSKKIIPNLAKMGYDVLVFAHWISNPEAMEKVKNLNLQEFGYDLSNIVFSAYNPLEGVAIAPFRTLKESREIVSFFEKLGESTGVLTREPTILFLSLQEGIKIRDHVYGPIIHSLTAQVP